MPVFCCFFVFLLLSVVFAPDGSVIVTLSGTFIKQQGDVAWTSTGLLVYAANNTILVQDVNGTIVTQFNVSETFGGVAVVSGDRIAATTIVVGSTKILLYSLTGQLLATLASPSLGLTPYGLAYSTATPDVLYDFDQNNNKSQ